MLYIVRIKPLALKEKKNNNKFKIYHNEKIQCSAWAVSAVKHDKGTGYEIGWLNKKVIITN